MKRAAAGSGGRTAGSTCSSPTRRRRSRSPGGSSGTSRGRRRPARRRTRRCCATSSPSASAGADKASRFMQLCDAFGLPIVTLVDTPGMMVGPQAEATGLVRHTSRLLVTGACTSRCSPSPGRRGRARAARPRADDDVVDPAGTRSVIASTLAAATRAGIPDHGHRFVDTW